MPFCLRIRRLQVQVLSDAPVFEQNRGFCSMSDGQRRPPYLILRWQSQKLQSSERSGSKLLPGAQERDGVL